MARRHGTRAQCSSENLFHLASLPCPLTPVRPYAHTPIRPLTPAGLLGQIRRWRRILFHSSGAGGASSPGSPSLMTSGTSAILLVSSVLPLCHVILYASALTTRRLIHHVASHATLPPFGLEPVQAPTSDNQHDDNNIPSARTVCRLITFSDTPTPVSFSLISSLS